MKVVCKNDTDSMGKILSLTIDKSYEVISTDSYGYKVINDTGTASWFYYERFYSVSETRDNTLNQILT